MFINRQSELKRLEEIYRRPGAQFVAVYGRRRIGKTALLCRWLECRSEGNAIYWVAYRSSSKLLLASFSQAVQPLMGVQDPGFTFSSWQAAFRQLGVLAKKRRIVVVLDEFPYLLESSPEVATVLQAAWDHEMKSGRIVLVVSGSDYHMMHDELVSAGGALYGRTTADIRVDPIGPDDLSGFLPRYGMEQIVETYSVIGGVPKYLELWDSSRPVMWNLRNVILSPVTIFRQEPAFLIQDEIRDARTYLGILDAIGVGMRSPMRIAETTGIPLPHAGKYLQTLQVLALIRREVSLDAEHPEHSRLTRYEICDPYLRFHFTFIRPHQALLEQGRIDALMRQIEARFDAYVGQTGYEELCRRIVIRLGDSGRLPFVPERVGRLWNRRAEVDVAAVDSRHRAALLGECKWTAGKISLEVLEELTRKAACLDRLEGYKMHYALFSRGGFDAKVRRVAREQGILLVHGLDCVEGV